MKMRVVMKMKYMNAIVRIAAVRIHLMKIDIDDPNLVLQSLPQGESVDFQNILCSILVEVRIFEILCVEYFENQSIQKNWDIQNISQDYFEYSDFQQIFNSSIF